MMYDNSQTAAQVMTQVNQILAMGLKLGGDLAKAVLLKTLEKVKETKENKKGLVKLKSLLSSKEELGVIKINKDNLAAFKQQAKTLGIQFASIESKSGNDVKIMYKTRQTNLVKDVLTELLEQEKLKKENKKDDKEEKKESKENEKESKTANEKDKVDEKNTENEEDKNNDKANKEDIVAENLTYAQLNKYLDFPGVDDGFYRHKIKNGVDNEHATALKELLEKEGIKNDISVTRYLDSGRFEVEFIIPEKDKDRAKSLIEENKGLSKEELKEKIAAKEDRKPSLDDQISKAEKQKVSKAADKSSKKIEKVFDKGER